METIIKYIGKVFTLIVKKLLNSKKEEKLDKNLKKNLTAMTILDIIMVPENKKYLRLINYFKERNMEKYIMDNGKGDTLLIYFLGENILVKGFDHESTLNQFAKEDFDANFIKNIYSSILTDLKKLLSKEEMYETTFVTCYSSKDRKWKEKKFEDNDGGKSYLLKYICKSAEEWCKWAKDYYEKDFNVKLVKKIYNGNVNSDIIKLLNPDCNLDETLKLIEDVANARQ